MSFRITDACIACGNCSVVCSQKAIFETDSPSKTSVEGSDSSIIPAGGYTATGPIDLLGPFYYISSGCNQCGSCPQVCPAGAIVWDD